MAEIDRLVLLRKQFDDIYERYLRDNSLFQELKNIVLQIEKEQKQYDLASGFVDAQLKVHDLFIKIPTKDERIGNIDNGRMANIVSNTQEILDKLQPTQDSSIEYNLVGIGPGSTVLIYDIIQKGSRLVQNITVESTKKKLQTLFSNAPKFMEKGFSQEKLNEITVETGLDNDQVYEITKSLSKLLPSRTDEIEKIELAVNEGNIQTSFTAESNDYLNLLRSKSNIYEIVRPEEKTILEGKLGIMEEWEVNHKIVIIDIDQVRYTINYSPTDFNIKKIKDNIGLDVKIKRERDAEDKRRWILVSWLENNTGAEIK